MSTPTQQAGSPPRTVAEFSALAELEEPAMALLREDPRAFITALVEAELFPDAVSFLAHVLPRNYAVWWAWLCAGGNRQEGRPPPAQAALDAVWRWIEQPTDANRRAALAAAEAADVGTPEGCAAFAVFLSGGSVAPPEAPPVEPDEFAAAKAIGGSVILSAVVREPEQAPEKFKTFIAHGLEVANRTRLWPAA
jgi:hypothetical protein